MRATPAGGGMAMLIVVTAGAVRLLHTALSHWFTDGPKVGGAAADPHASPRFLIYGGLMPYLR